MKTETRNFYFYFFFFFLNLIYFFRYIFQNLKIKNQNNYEISLFLKRRKQKQKRQTQTQWSVYKNNGKGTEKRCGSTARNRCGTHRKPNHQYPLGRKSHHATWAVPTPSIPYRTLHIISLLSYSLLFIGSSPFFLRSFNLVHQYF